IAHGAVPHSAPATIRAHHQWLDPVERRGPDGPARTGDGTRPRRRDRIRLPGTIHRLEPGVHDRPPDRGNAVDPWPRDPLHVTTSRDRVARVGPRPGAAPAG